MQIIRNFRGRQIFRREDEVECFEGIYQKDKKSFEGKTEWWECKSWSKYLGSIPIKTFSRGGLISIKDCVELAIRGWEVYVHQCEERLI